MDRSIVILSVGLNACPVNGLLIGCGPFIPLNLISGTDFETDAAMISMSGCARGVDSGGSGNSTGLSLSSVGLGGSASSSIGFSFSGALGSAFSAGGGGGGGGGAAASAVLSNTTCNKLTRLVTNLFIFILYYLNFNLS